MIYVDDVAAGVSTIRCARRSVLAPELLNVKIFRRRSPNSDEAVVDRLAFINLRLGWKPVIQQN